MHIADIRLCQNNECPSREDCGRYYARYAEWQLGKRQSYTNIKHDPEDGKCDKFFHVKADADHGGRE